MQVTMEAKDAVINQSSKAPAYFQVQYSIGTSTYRVNEQVGPTECDFLLGSWSSGVYHD